MARTKHSIPRYVTGITAPRKKLTRFPFKDFSPIQHSRRRRSSSSSEESYSDDSSSEESDSDGLETQNLAGAMDHPPPPKKTKVEIVADAVPSAGLDEYGCETDEDTDHPTVLDEMREQLKELKKKLEEKDVIISQLNERISDLEQGNCKMAAAAKKDDTDADDDDVEVESESKIEQPKEQPKEQSRKKFCLQSLTLLASVASTKGASYSPCPICNSPIQTSVKLPNKFTLHCLQCQPLRRHCQAKKHIYFYEVALPSDFFSENDDVNFLIAATFLSTGWLSMIETMWKNTINNIMSNWCFYIRNCDLRKYTRRRRKSKNQQAIYKAIRDEAIGKVDNMKDAMHDAALKATLWSDFVEKIEDIVKDSLLNPDYDADKKEKLDSFAYMLRVRFQNLRDFRGQLGRYF